MSPKGHGSRRGPGWGAARGGGRNDVGPGGECECSKCGHRIPHQTGKPCLDIPCPKCGSQMIRREK